jgi:GNAT superfamily N-acetyltransferase
VHITVLDPAVGPPASMRCASRLVRSTGGLLLARYGPLADELTLADTRHAPSFRSQRCLLLWGADRLVGLAFMAWDRRAPAPLASAHICVAQAERRRGHGRALLDGLSASAAGLGLGGLAFKALAGSPGEAFLAATGASRSGAGVRLTGRLGRAGPVQPRLSRSLRLRSWEGPWPRDIAGRLLRLRDSGRETSAESLCALRATQATWAATGYRWWTAAVEDRRTGEVLAATELFVSPSRPDTGFVHATVVEAEHRGRGLASAARLEVVRRAVPSAPGVRRFVTFNGLANHGALALNDRLGFARARELAFWDMSVARPSRPTCGVQAKIGPTCG